MMHVRCQFCAMFWSCQQRVECAYVKLCDEILMIHVGELGRSFKLIRRGVKQIK